MIKIYRQIKDLSFSQLMLVYQEGNEENAAEFYPELDQFEGVIKAEQDFYSYLRDDFFKASDAFYAVWEESGQYISALRMETYGDGYLLEALETRPDMRCRGYAKKLLNEVVSRIDINIYSHVKKSNLPSLRVHFACGFQIVSDNASFIDGSVSSNAYTLCLKQSEQ